MIVTTRFPAANGFNNVFDDLFGTLQHKSKSNKNDSIVPVNIVESEKGCTISFSAPGRIKEAFKINFENGLLTVGYAKGSDDKETEDKFIRKEFENGAFKRSFSLDKEVNADEIEAKYENGVLTVFVPKKQITNSSTKQIVIQ